MPFLIPAANPAERTVSIILLELGQIDHIIPGNSYLCYANKILTRSDTLHPKFPLLFTRAPDMCATVIIL